MLVPTQKEEGIQMAPTDWLCENCLFWEIAPVRGAGWGVCIKEEMPQRIYNTSESTARGDYRTRCDFGCNQFKKVADEPSGKGGEDE